MNYKEGLKEVGKTFLNLSVAFIVFLILQPFIKDKLSIPDLLLGFIAFILSITVGFFLVSLGGNENE